MNKSMVSDYFKALKKGETGAIIKLVILLVLAWFLYKYFTKVEGFRASTLGTTTNTGYYDMGEAPIEDTSEDR